MSKTVRILGLSVLIVAALALAFGAGCSLGSQAQPDSAQGLGVVTQAWDIIFRDYVDQGKLDSQLLSHAAIQGMIDALDDPYTSYMDADTYRLGLGNLKGKIGGIGAEVTIRDKQITIIAPIADSPAAKAGIRAGDKILEVDGNSTSGMGLAEAVFSIRGPKGTSVRLLVLHEDKTEPEIIVVVRDEIKLPSVRFEMMGDIAYINITRFSETTDEELTPVVEDIVQGKATGIILDLRSNPGGLLSTVVKVTSHFLKDGIVVYVVDNHGERTSMEVISDSVKTDLPMVVLVDSHTASGGEVLTGALKDHGRATVAGTKTFGKGSVDVLHQLKDGSGIYITTARWLTPNGSLIEGEGLEPEYKLELKGEEAIQWAIDYLKDRKS